jgi:hypothetical protein
VIRAGAARRREPNRKHRIQGTRAGRASFHRRAFLSPISPAILRKTISPTNTPKRFATPRHAAANQLNLLLIFVHGIS